MKVLVVEDDLAISNLIKLNLSVAGYESTQAYDGEEALEKVKETAFDIIILDVMLPKIDGFTLFEKIKPLNIPVIFLTAKTSVSDRVYGLKLGAYDYITKPFEGLELLARIENILSHYIKKEQVIRIRDLEIYLEEMVVKKSGESIELTPKEFELLVFLVKNKNIVLTRDKIIEKIWGYDYLGETRTIDNHIQKLRKKLDLKEQIKTVFKLGYRLDI